MDFNRAHLSIEPLNVALNDAVERAAATTAEQPRPYLGASIVGDECLYFDPPLSTAEAGRPAAGGRSDQGARAGSNRLAKLRVHLANSYRLMIKELADFYERNPFRSWKILLRFRTLLLICQSRT